MGAIRESDEAIREKYEAYNTELAKASSELSKVCAICTRPIIVTKDGIKKQCDDCVHKKSLDIHMKLYAKHLEIMGNLKTIIE